MRGKLRKSRRCGLFGMALLLVCVGLGPRPGWGQAAGLSPIPTESGKLQGVLDAGGEVRAFKGIPFAAPPVGDLRWRAPVRLAASAALLPADQFSASCMQKIRRELLPWTPEYMIPNDVSEDCLYLNVWAPAAKAAKPRGVLVFIHGGAFTSGSGGIAIYDGAALARRGIVVVTVNYRLGIFGFLAHPELAKESGHNSAGNYGLLDQVAALEWVKRNIAAFGGDPAKVTISGQSAGAQSVLELLASPLAKGLFAGAIAESGATIYMPSPPPAASTASSAGESWATAHGSLANLRRMPAADLIALADIPPAAQRPNVDGYVLPVSPVDELKHPVGSDVPVIVGWNADEGSSNASYGKQTAAEFKKAADTRFGAGKVEDQYLSIYPTSGDVEAGQSQIAADRDRNFVGATEWARAWTSQRKSPAYVYYFDRVPPWKAHPEFKVYHTAEVPYVFDNLAKNARDYTAKDYAVAHEMSERWIRFVETGRPDAPGLKPWPAANGDGKVMELGDQMGPKQFVPASTAAFWKGYFASAH
jgi:para-nitrobenzyl esterase